MLLLTAIACDLPKPEPLPTDPNLQAKEKQTLVADDEGPSDFAMPGIAAAAEPEVQTLDEPTGPRVMVRHILIPFVGSGGADPTTRRNEREARKLIEELRERAAGGEDFATLAREYSEGPSGKDGGRLPPFSTGAMVPPFEQAAFALQPGEISQPVSTEFGLHLILREALVERRIAHIMIQWAGAAGATTERTRLEAEALANMAMEQVQQGTDFAKVAQEYSDGPTAIYGGELGILQKGQMAPQFDEVAFALEPGAVSELVESPFGLHILKRLDL